MHAATELAGIISNDAAAPVPNIADNIDHNEQLADNIHDNEQPIDAAAVHNIGNKAINNDPQYVVVEVTNDAAAPVGLMESTIKDLDDQLELRGGRMCDLEATIVDLEQKMTALSERNWTRCTLPNSRFSYKSEFSLDEGLNLV